MSAGEGRAAGSHGRAARRPRPQRPPMVCPFMSKRPFIFTILSVYMFTCPFIFTSLSVYVYVNGGHGRAARRPRPPRPLMVCPFMSKCPFILSKCPFMFTCLSVYVRINGGHGRSSRRARPPRLLLFRLLMFTCPPMVCPFMFTRPPIVRLFIFMFREARGV